MTATLRLVRLAALAALAGCVALGTSAERPDAQAGDLPPPDDVPGELPGEAGGQTDGGTDAPVMDLPAPDGGLLDASDGGPDVRAMDGGPDAPPADNGAPDVARDAAVDNPAPDVSPDVGVVRPDASRPDAGPADVPRDVPCGGAGQGCCAGASPCGAGLNCVAGSCVNGCGDNGQSCCAGRACAAGFACDLLNHCACGNLFQPCCAGGLCNLSRCNGADCVAL